MNNSTFAPLAERMRPKNLEEYIGQKHLLGEKGVLQAMLNTGNLPSLLFWGPPGVGKTTLAELMAKMVKRPFYRLSAIQSGVKEVREVIEQAQKGGLFQQHRPVLFVDEIHRFSKSQQDSLLGAVEKGVITLIGATTENPSFEVIPALLSRCQVYTLEPLSKDELLFLVKNAIEKDVELKERKIVLEEYEELLMHSGGDARKLLNILEILAQSNSNGELVVSNELVRNTLQKSPLAYDKAGEWHYDIVSVFIKSIRGSDPNAAVYWLARMTEAGEDPLFIARRLLILSSEDIGNANPTALVIATNCFQAVHSVGYPECSIILSQTVCYLATSPKSNATYEAIKSAQQIVRDTGNLPVPMHLRNAPTKLMKEMGYGSGYKYAHSYDGNFVDQNFLPNELEGKKLYEPGNNPRENQTRQFLKDRWKDKYDY